LNLFLKNNYLNLTITFCAIVFLSVVLNYNNKISIDGDARDYYSYLVSIFIDSNFTNQTGNNWYLINTPTGTINVHTIGTALLILPFFLISTLYAKLSGFEVNGFSSPFQMAVYFAGIFYCIVGLLFLKKLLLKLEFKKNIIALLIFLTCFGTHLFHYTVSEPGMSHVYSFALTSSLFYYTIQLIQTKQTKYYYLIGFVFGLVILVRPVNAILFISLPFFFQNYVSLANFFKTILKTKHFYFSLIFAISVCSVQSLAWYLQNGKILQDSYLGNGFYFTQPQIFKMLFGFNNGLFVYVPLCLLFLVGIISILKTNRYKGFIFIISLTFFIYIFASYWAYNYFDGFGIRVFVDYLPLIVIAGAYLWQNTKLKTHYVLNGFAFILVAITQVYLYQYRSGIIKGNGMNFNKFNYVFLKTNKNYADSLGGSSDIPLYTKHKIDLLYEKKKMMFNDRMAGDSVFNFSNLEYGNDVNFKLDKNGNNFFVVTEFERKETFNNSSYSALLCLNATNQEKISKQFQAFKLNETPSNNCCDWKKYAYSIAVTGKFEQNDILSVFVWNKEKQPFLIKNLNIKIYDYSYKL